MLSCFPCLRLQILLPLWSWKQGRHKEQWKQFPFRLAVNETPAVRAHKNQENFYCSQRVSGTLDKWLLIILICSQLVEHNNDLTDYVISVSVFLEA